MKKVLHLSHTNIKYDSRILKEIHALDASGYDVTAIGVDASEGVCDSSMSDALKIYAIALSVKKLYFLPKLILHSLSVLEITFKMFFRIIKIKPNIIHCHDTLVLPIGVVCKFLLGSKLIYDAHELESDRNGLSKLLGRMTLGVEKFFWSSIDALIVVSPSIEQWYKNKCGHKESAVILNSPVLKSTSSLYFNHNYLRETFNIAPESIIFIYIGILAPGRGIEQVFEVFERGNVQSDVIFLGYGEYTDLVKAKSKKVTNIHYHDAVSHEEVVSIASSADIGLCLIQNVSLSDYYCLPNKLFEYCFSGIPVIASNFPDIARVVEQFKLGRCCDLDVESIEREVLSIESKRSFGAIDTSELTTLSWQAQALKLNALYSKL
jgi:glycosyltransferase involved in cell wall biosynthesis